METNLPLDTELLERAFRVSGEKTKKAAVTKALREFIARREQRALLELLGKLDWDPEYDCKAERSRRLTGLGSLTGPTTRGRRPRGATR